MTAYELPAGYVRVALRPGNTIIAFGPGMPVIFYDDTRKAWRPLTAVKS